MKSIVAIAFCVQFALLGPAFADSAARLTEISGPVMVDSGAGFQSVREQIDLATGSRVLVRQKGKATLTYQDGCTLTLQQYTISSVGSPDACNKQAQVASDDGRKKGLFLQNGNGGGFLSALTSPAGVIALTGLGVTTFAIVDGNNNAIVDDNNDSENLPISP